MSVISTLAREEALFVFGDGAAFTDNPFFQKGLTPERLALLKSKKREEQANDPARPRWLAMFDTDKKNLKKLADAGVRVGFGTDSGGALDRYFIQGFFEHRQMELMRDAGLTPMQIIQSFSQEQRRAARHRQGLRHARQGQGRRPPGAHPQSARRHHPHAHDRGRLSRRQEIRIGRQEP